MDRWKKIKCAEKVSIILACDIRLAWLLKKSKVSKDIKKNQEDI